MQARTQPRTPEARWAVWILAIVAWLLVVAIVTQVFVVGMNVLLRPAYWGVHITLGHAIGGLLLIQLMVVVLGRLPARVGWAAAAMVLLMGLQYNARALAHLAGVPALAALHAVNALLLFWLAVSLGRWAWQQLHDAETIHALRDRRARKLA